MEWINCGCFSENTKTKLRQIINEDSEYRSGSRLVDFFNQFYKKFSDDIFDGELFTEASPVDLFEMNFKDSYDNFNGRSRWKYTDDKISNMDDGLLKRFIEYVFCPDKFIGKSDLLKSLMTSFNEVLLFDGFKLVNHNKLTVTLSKCDNDDLIMIDNNVELFDMGNFHPHIQKYKTLFLQEHYFLIISEVCKLFENTVKEKSGINDKFGTDLMMKAFAVGSGKIKINSGTSKTETNIQTGIMYFAAGLTSAVRNVTSHENHDCDQFKISKDDCTDLLHFISYLFRVLDDAG